MAQANGTSPGGARGTPKPPVAPKRNGRPGAVFLTFFVIGTALAFYNGGSIEQKLPEPVRARLEAARTHLREFVSRATSGSSMPTDTASVLQEQQRPVVAACGIEGQVAGCGCDYASTESLIQHEVEPVLSKLVKLPFFRYFKVNLYCDCEFWPDAGMCFSPDCCVEACEDSEIPEAWRLESQPLQAAAAAGGKQQQQQQQEHACSDPISPVDRSVDDAVALKLSSVPNWSGLNNPWVPGDDEGVEYIYVNLQLNPERYTGYKGEDARRIWASIYAQSAFDDVHGRDLAVSPEILEKQVLYRLISGMHSSITTSIIKNYYNETSGLWGPNVPFFKARFTGDRAKPYVENLYFTFLFLLRAVVKAGPVLDQFDYRTGCPNDDGLTQELMHQLVRSPALVGSCQQPFDEGMLWQAREPAERQKLEEQLQSAFHNITKLMDCVGCEKCKMWGKVQMLGIATSLKILFSQQPVTLAPSEGSGSAPAEKTSGLQLHRNEVIALVNMLHKMAESVDIVRELSLVVAQEQQAAAAVA